MTSILPFYKHWKGFALQNVYHYGIQVMEQQKQWYLWHLSIFMYLCLYKNGSNEEMLETYDYRCIHDFFIPNYIIQTILVFVRSFFCPLANSLLQSLLVRFIYLWPLPKHASNIRSIRKLMHHEFQIQHCGIIWHLYKNEWIFKTNTKSFILD